jgi:hypothetical protein
MANAGDPAVMRTDPLGDGSQSLTTGVWTGQLPPVREPCG